MTVEEAEVPRQPRGTWDPGPFVCFGISGGYFLALVFGAYAYLEWGFLSGIHDPRRMIPIAWIGSIGATVAGLHGLVRNANMWKPHLWLWYLVRPFSGAVFGAVGYLIFIAIVQASVDKDAVNDLRPTALGYAVAFTLGYREEMFRELLKRVTDLLATAGGADVEPPSAPPDFAAEVVGGGVRLTWRPSSDNVAVTGYRIYRDHRFLATVLVTVADARACAGQGADQVEFVDRRDGGDKAFYSVTAVDNAGNESDPAGPIRPRLATSATEETGGAP